MKHKTSAVSLKVFDTFGGLGVHDYCGALKRK